MREFLLKLLREQDGWVRLIIGLILASFVAGRYWNHLQATLADHEKRIVRIELAFEKMPSILERLEQKLNGKLN